MAEPKGRFLQKNRKAVFNIAFVLVLSVLFSAFAWNNTLDFLEQKLVDFRFQYFNQNKPVSQDIVYIDISEEALQNLSPTVGGWPWLRGEVVGEILIDTIMQGNPSVLLFDILYSEYTSKTFSEGEIPEQDMILSGISSAYPNLSHGALLINKPRPVPQLETLQQSLEAFFYLKATVGPHPPEIPAIEGLVLPYHPLSEDSQSLHLVNRKEDSDGVSRNYNLVYQYQDHYLPSLVLQGLKFKWGIESVELANQAITLKLADGTTKKLDLDRKGRLPINFNSNLDEFISYHADNVILSGKGAIQGTEAFQPQDVEGKIVIIGASATGLKDQIVTPTGTNFAGPYFHITALSNILTGDHLVLPAPYVTAFIILLLVSTIVSLTIWLKNSLVKNLIGLIILLSTILVLLFGFRFAGVLFDVSSIMGASILAFLGALVFMSFTEGAEKNKISQAMGKYLAPAVMKEVLERYDELIGEVGEKKEISVLFSDIRGFTSISEAYPPETVVSVLNSYLEEMIDVVFEHNGTLDKMIGDAIMAFWGAPNSDPHKELNSVRTAVDMIKRLEKLNARLRDEGKIELQIGVGINTGPMIVGNIGSSKRLDYTLIGDNVNLGSRLEGLTKYYRVPIIVSGSTWDAISSQFEGLSLDSVAVKGKESGVPIVFPMIEAGSGSEVEGWRQERAAFDEVRAHYLAQDFPRAATGFRDLSRSLKKLNGLAEVYQDRAMHFLENPPARDWDGCWKMLEK